MKKARLAHNTNKIQPTRLGRLIRTLVARGLKAILLIFSTCKSHLPGLCSCAARFVSHLIVIKNYQISVFTLQ